MCLSMSDEENIIRFYVSESIHSLLIFYNTIYNLRMYGIFLDNHVKSAILINRI